MQSKSEAKGKSKLPGLVNLVIVGYQLLDRGKMELRS